MRGSDKQRVPYFPGNIKMSPYANSIVVRYT